MDRKNISINIEEFPQNFRSMLESATVYDSSCSKEAQVYFVDRDEGYYLKKSEKGALKREAEMTRYFHDKGLSAEVMEYESEAYDWLLTRRIPGEDCTFHMYLENPEKLCEKTAQLLRQLHESDLCGCPVENRTEEYLETVSRNYYKGQYDLDLFCGEWSFSSADEAFAFVQRNKGELKADTLLHGDYCLPNILLDNWKFSGFIDLDCAGAGDRHIDIFWGVWTLWFNLKTNKYKDRFLDAYGRDIIENELLRTVAAAEIFR